MIIYIKVANSHPELKFAINVTDTKMTIEAFKELVVEKSSIPAQEQRLIYKGKILENVNSVESYGAKNEDTFIVIQSKPLVDLKNDKPATQSTAQSTASNPFNLMIQGMAELLYRPNTTNTEDSNDVDDPADDPDSSFKQDMAEVTGMVSGLLQNPNTMQSLAGLAQSVMFGLGSMTANNGGGANNVPRPAPINVTPVTTAMPAPTIAPMTPVTAMTPMTPMTPMTLMTPITPITPTTPVTSVTPIPVLSTTAINAMSTLQRRMQEWQSQQLSQQQAQPTQAPQSSTSNQQTQTQPTIKPGQLKQQSASVRQPTPDLASVIQFISSLPKANIPTDVKADNTTIQKTPLPNYAVLYADQLLQLELMGFNDDDINMGALIATNGDLDKAVERIVASKPYLPCD